MKRLRICMVNDNFGRSSGAAIAIRRIARLMPEFDFYAAGCGDGPLEEDLSWVPAGHHAQFDLKSTNPIRLWSELRRLKRWMCEQDICLVPCHHRRLAVLLRALRIPLVYTAHLAFPYESWFRWLSPRWMTAVSPSVGTNVFETTRRKVLACIGNPIPFPSQAPFVNWKEVGGRAVCVARLSPVKGHVHLLRAWKILLDRGHRFQLDLVGEGPLLQVLQNQVERDGLGDLVSFRGFTPDVAEHVKCSLFAVLVSEVEGQGMVTLEAAALGRASLLTAVAGSIDQLPPDRALPNGLPYGDASSLADALVAWFRNPAVTAQEGQTFFDNLRKSSNLEAIAQAYRHVYSTVQASA